jgi:hypothetical protein
MKTRAPWLAAALLLALAGPARAQVKDAAELLPAQTLACLELRQPDLMAREVAALVKGSALDDLPATMAKFRAKLTGVGFRPWLIEEVALLGLFLSPEAIGEGGRLQGGVVALTGITKDGPEVVGILLAGESNLPTLYTRAYLSIVNVQTVAEVEGVNLYRERRQIFRKGDTGPVEEDNGPVLALLPGTIVAGSNVECVKDVVRRYKGKSADPALPSVAAYKEAAKLRDRAGLFAYADMGALAGRMREATKALGPKFAQEWALVETVVNPNALRAVTASLTLQNGTLEFQALVKLNPSEKSPLVELLPAKAAGSGMLHFVPRDSLLSVCLDLSDGEKRWEKLVPLIDALSKVSGGSELNPPSKAIKELEDQLKLRFARDVFGRVTGLAVAVDVESGKKEPGSPLLVVQAVDAEAARFLEETAVPKLLGLLRGGDAPPMGEKIDGRQIYAVPMQLFPGQKAFCWGRQGSVLVLGPSSARVANALTVGGKKQGVLGEAKVAAALKDLDGPIAVGVGSLGRGVIELFREGHAPGGRNDLGPKAKKDERPAPPAPDKLPDYAEKAVAALTKLFEPLPPTVVTLDRKADSLVLQMRQPGLKSVSAKLIDIVVDTALQRLSSNPGAGTELAPLQLKEIQEAQRQADEAARRVEEARKKEQDKKP